jgi:hypothetical protein
VCALCGVTSYGICVMPSLVGLSSGDNDNRFLAAVVVSGRYLFVEARESTVR